MPTGQAVSECAGYVLVSAGEFSAFQVIDAALAVPTQEAALAWFGATFGLVLVGYVLASLVGQVANFFNSD